VTVYLIRHGETHWNRKHRLQGILDVPLNCAGLSQARTVDLHEPTVARKTYLSRDTERPAVARGGGRRSARDRSRELDRNDNCRNCKTTFGRALGLEVEPGEISASNGGAAANGLSPEHKGFVPGPGFAHVAKRAACEPRRCQRAFPAFRVWRAHRESVGVSPTARQGLRSPIEGTRNQ
jgi:Histidine phosphatase superfamily (branch 1)